MNPFSELWHEVWPEGIAGITASIIVGIALAYKFLLRFRKDWREDQSGEDQQGGYSSLLKYLQSEITRLNTVITSLDSRLSAEGVTRRGVEREMEDLRAIKARLELRVHWLEGHVVKLGGNIHNNHNAK